MKKFISILLSLIMVIGTSTVAFADGNITSETSQAPANTQNSKLTPEQQQARDAYLKVYFDDMNQLVALRQQTQDAVAANNAAAKEIKDKLSAKTAINKDTVAKLKDLAAQRKALTEQAKQLHQQRLSLRDQFKEAVKAKDTSKMTSIEQQILDLNSQVANLKTQDEAIKAQVAPLKDQLNSMRDANKQLRDNVKSQLQQARTIQDSIKTMEQEKAQLWTTYRENIKNKDYAAAETTFKSIIDKKSAILDKIKERGTIINQVLASLN